MPNQRERNAQGVIEHQADAIDGLMALRQDDKIRRDPRLVRAVERIQSAVTRANALSCVLWFPRDTTADVDEFLPPAA